MEERRTRAMRLAGAAAASSILWMTLTGISTADDGLLGGTVAGLVAGVTQPDAGASVQGSAPPSASAATILNIPGTTLPVPEAQALPGSGSPLPAPAPAVTAPPPPASVAAPVPVLPQQVQASPQATPSVTQAPSAVTQAQTELAAPLSASVAQVSETLSQVTEQVSQTTTQVENAAGSAGTGATLSTPIGVTSALEGLPETVAEIDGVLDETIAGVTAIETNETPPSPLATTLETAVLEPLTGPATSSATIQLDAAPLLDTDTPGAALSVQVPAVSEILSGPTSSPSASSAPPHPTGSSASTTAPAPAATTQTSARTESTATTGTGPAASPSAPVPSANLPAGSSAISPLMVDQVETFGPWLGSFGAPDPTGDGMAEAIGSSPVTQEDPRSAPPASSPSDRPSFLPPEFLPQIARTIGADGWMVPWMAAAFVMATCFASIYIFAVRRD